MRVQYDLKKEPGKRVSQILIRNTNDPTGGLELLDTNMKYRIGMPSFIANGGSRFPFMENIAHEETG